MQERSLAYQLQDLVCSKCGEMKADSTSLYCSCSGAWTCVQSAKSCQDALLPYLNASKFHGFKWLHETVQWAIQIAEAPAETIKAKRAGAIEVGDEEEEATVY